MSSRSELAERADPIDRHVGVRIRLRRKQLRMTQVELAELLGVTFQQIQKYERAANRVSASKLWEVSQALQATIGYFYDGLEDEESAATPANTQALLLSREGVELAEAFRAIGCEKRRALLLNLIGELGTSVTDHGAGR